MIDHDACAYVEDGTQCDNPASIKVKCPAPPPYAHLMMEMWMCAEHYDQWMKERSDASGMLIEGDDND
jgi:hypothetical protein